MSGGYRHQFSNGKSFEPSLSKIVCVGRNYAEHARELNNPIPRQALLFIKPATAAVSLAQPLLIPHDRGECHHELELSILIGSPLTRANEQQCLSAIAGIGLGIDLTLRDVQTELKAKGQPWERAKAFDGSCPLSAFIELDGHNLQELELTLWRNGELQQQGNTCDMLFPVASLLAEISHTFSLLPGDVVMTGTPAGVGPLCCGDELLATLDDLLRVATRVL
jgi:2-keto-4-pentenoate hydratase/2-oxohepta-3-ene-1,7-dioic acid hydratase in catechol pathway